jgi:valyl-tRNA synthetase
LSSSSVVGHVSVFVPMKGLIDPKAELSRLQKDLDKVQKQHDQIATKLSKFADQLAKIKANME